MIYYRDAVPGTADLEAMLDDLRTADIEEWRQASGKTPAEHCRDNSWVVPDNTPDFLTRVAYGEQGEPLLLYGVSPGAFPGFGYVWLIACNRAEKHVIEFHKSWDAEIDRLKLSGRYPRFYTASWVGNARHHKWLRWLGFKSQGIPIPYGPIGGLFQPFTYGV